MSSDRWADGALSIYGGIKSPHKNNTEPLYSLTNLRYPWQLCSTVIEMSCLEDLRSSTDNLCPKMSKRTYGFWMSYPEKIWENLIHSRCRKATWSNRNILRTNEGEHKFNQNKNTINWTVKKTTFHLTK